MTHVFKHFSTPSEMSISELQETAAVLVIAGSETSASLLTGLTYHLLKNPTQLRILVAETRAAFRSESDITFANVAQLRYQLAAINEALRLFPPVPGTLARLTPPEGHVVAGAWVPGGTLVAVNHWAAFRSHANFHNSEVFAPERWLDDDGQYEGDILKVVQPFSYGPRNCIGKPLAYAQVRLLMAKLLWNFDMELCEESADWLERLKIYLVYEKAPLMVKLTPVRRD
jgi:cytochrome P450